MIRDSRKSRRGKQRKKLPLPVPEKIFEITTCRTETWTLLILIWNWRKLQQQRWKIISQMRKNYCKEHHFRQQKFLNKTSIIQFLKHNRQVTVKSHNHNRQVMVQLQNHSK
ncbi:uncharacterized protein [Venturia canescens]|uniref:uncharacterized protein n=1 Tax=Venturia canescens TaxID=32260 RepID=UPI001C9C1C1E|nr:uncharacterized protein LOC122411395 [Venturia canescens]